MHISRHFDSTKLQAMVNGLRSLQNCGSLIQNLLYFKFRRQEFEKGGYVFLENLLTLEADVTFVVQDS
jgi:hypothetical protein